MPTFDRERWRAATDITQALREYVAQSAPAWDPSGPCFEITKLQRLRDDAIARNWHAAARQLSERLHLRLRWLQTDLTGCVRQFAIQSGEEWPVSTRGVYDELSALAEDFDRVTVDRRQHTVTAVTDPVELDGVHLGRFVVVWDWSELGDNRECRVMAEEPRHPAGREDITHPHVQDDRLCEGDAQRPLQHALRTGRLSDYFSIIARVLATYNDESAFVSIYDWSRRRCPWCNMRLSTEDVCQCDLCDGELCDACQVQCSQCGSYACRDCCELCDECDEFCCRVCRSASSAAGPGCPNCQQETAHEEDLADPSPQGSGAEIAPAAVYADGVGEAAVPAGSR